MPGSEDNLCVGGPGVAVGQGCHDPPPVRPALPGASAQGFPFALVLPDRCRLALAGTTGKIVVRGGPGGKVRHRTVFARPRATQQNRPPTTTETSSGSTASASPFDTAPEDATVLRLVTGGVATVV